MSGATGWAGDDRVPAIVAQLRTRTAAQHRHIERNRLARFLLDGSVTTAGYTAVLARFLGFHAAIEPQIAASLGRTADFAALRWQRTPALEHDLAALGLEPVAVAALPRCTALPAIATTADALGCLYVLEGSRRGGRVIVRRVAACLPLGAAAACGYFGSAGADAAATWRALCASLDGASRSAEGARAIVTAAVATFESLDAWLGGAGQA